MTSKITLYSENHLIEQIKIYAKEQNTSVSKIVNEFFMNLLESRKYEQPKSKITDGLVGRLDGANVDEKSYQEYLTKKYL